MMQATDSQTVSLFGLHAYPCLQHAHLALRFHTCVRGWIALSGWLLPDSRQEDWSINKGLPAHISVSTIMLLLYHCTTVLLYCSGRIPVHCGTACVSQGGWGGGQGGCAVRGAAAHARGHLQGAASANYMLIHISYRLVLCAPVECARIP